MLSVLWLAFGSLLRIFRNRRDLIFENFVLRQQLAVLKRRRPRPALNLFDKLFWVAISRLWLPWKQALIVVSPETVVRWHRAGFRMYWRLISRVRGPVGRRPTPKEVRELIFHMVAENPTWGAPRIHGELLMLGFDISERTIARWMKRAPRDPEPGKRWLAFLRNRQEVIAAMDFFTVPTIRFGMLYCFFVIAHGRRRILHFNVTKHPTSLWVVQQLREAFPFGSAPRFLIFDRDRKYGVEVPAAVRSLGIEAIQTSFDSPWQNGVAERWIESCRRELLDHIIALNERRLRRLLFDYVRYHHEDRTHLGLGKGTPAGRICSANAGGWGRTDVLVNNAGISLIAPAEKLSAAEYRRLLEINLVAPFLLAKAFGAMMLQQRSGSIISVASVAGLVGVADRAAYNASKHGLIGLTRTLASEWGGRGVRVNAVCPAWVKTEMDVADQP